jgi:short-subunit dehydrogenase
LPKLAEGDRGGFILVGAMGVEIGVPFTANDGGAKTYVHSLGEALHYEFKPQGVYVTVVPPAATNTPVLAKFPGSFQAA